MLEFNLHNPCLNTDLLEKQNLVQIVKDNQWMEQQKEKKCILPNKMMVSDWNIAPDLQEGFVRDQTRILMEKMTEWKTALSFMPWRQNSTVFSPALASVLL